MITRHNVQLSAIALIAALVGIIGVAHGAGDAGYPLPDGCYNTVIVRGDYDHPVNVIEAHGGEIAIDEARDPLFTLTVTGWTMHEDSEWGDMISYETEGTCLPPTVVTHPIILYIKGEAGDPEYDHYAATYGAAHGCKTMAVEDDAANPLYGYIHTIDLCYLSQADIDNVGEELGDLLLAMGQPVFLPVINR